MDERSLYQLTTTQLIDLLNNTRKEYLSFPRGSNEAREKKQEMDLIVIVIAAKKSNERANK